MEYDCHIFSKYLIFQMKNLVFQMKNPVFQPKYLVFRSKTLDFDRNTRYFNSKTLKYQVFHNLNLKYQVFRAKHLVFRKRCKISGFQWIICMSFSIGFRIPSDMQTLSKYYTSAELDQQQKHSSLFVNSFSNPTGESGEVIYKQI